MRRGRRSALVIAALAAALCGAAPATAAAPVVVAAADGAQADPSRSLGAVSPSCRYALDAEARRACRASGSVAQPHPLSSYGIDVRIGFSLTDPAKSFMSALQSLGAALWTALLYLLKATLLLLEWAFSLDLTSQAMPEVRDSLARLHGSVFGSSWLLLGITLAGLWGMWRGLVQQRATETMGALAATVALMVVGLVLISRPAETVGTAAKWTNDAGMSVLAAGTGGDPRQPRLALARSMASVFDATVRSPWCAVQFGSVEHCDARLPDRRYATNAELWLSFPAQSWQRGRLYRLTRGKADDGGGVLDTAQDLLGIGGEDDRKLPDEVESLVRESPDRVRLQEQGGTFPRLALLWTVGVGLLGAVAVLGWLGLRLLLAGAMTLLLLLLAPAMLIAPALGDSGRATFLAWGRRLVGALLAKLVYSVFLTAVLVAGTVFARLDIGWFGGWLLQAAFWWGVFLKRDEVLEFVSAGTPRGETRSLGQAMTQGYYALMLGRAARQSLGRAVAPVTGSATALRTSRADTRAARTAAVGELAGERLDEHGRQALAVDERSARTAASRREVLQHELRAVDRGLRNYDDAAAVARANGSGPPTPSPEDRALLRHRDALRDALADPVGREAEQAVRHADRNRALTGEPANRRDLDAWRTRREHDLAQDLPADDPAQLRAAGVDPERYDAAPPAVREQLLGHVRERLSEERALADVVRDPGTSASVSFDADDVARRTAAHRARLAEERRERRLRQGGTRRR